MEFFKYIWQKFDESTTWMNQKLVDLFPWYARAQNALHNTVNPIKLATKAFFTFIISLHIFFYQHLKGMFVEFVGKMQEISIMSGDIGDPGNMSAVNFLEKIEVANAIFPIDHLLNCTIFILSAWVIALEIKFTIFVIKLIKP